MLKKVPQMHLKSLLAASACLLINAAVSADPVAEPQGQNGSLIIAGGGLSPDTASVWQTFLESAHETGPFVIIPSASGSPAQSAASVEATLLKYGITSDRIAIAKLASRDDRSTERVNEAAWARNANDEKTASLLERAAGIWFTGGDQSRTTAILLDEAQEPTLALSALYRAHAAGTPIGGTSAGAAIMSDPMITQGDTLATLTGSGEGEVMELGPGLGFFAHGLVDQHFGERARLGRLAVALSQQEDAAKRIGFGIDEDTALIVAGDGTATVQGAGYVTVIDARAATRDTVSTGAVRLSRLTLHMLAAGDRIDLSTLALTPASWKKATVGEEYVEAALPGGGGMALGGQMLQDVIGEGLVDNAASDRVERISFDSTGRGVAYVFSQVPQSAGFWGRGPDGVGQYAIANVRFDIVPVALTLETVR
ncbi:MAG: cyanophycinase [Henriciella sp.]|nr:cyanophycinase [Henriciella sp.]